jgi:hypothetical protein
MKIRDHGHLRIQSEEAAKLGLLISDRDDTDGLYYSMGSAGYWMHLGIGPLNTTTIPVISKLFGLMCMISTSIQII